MKNLGQLHQWEEDEREKENGSPWYRDWEASLESVAIPVRLHHSHSAPMGIQISLTFVILSETRNKQVSGHARLTPHDYLDDNLPPLSIYPS